jgi:hypothetical protein
MEQGDYESNVKSLCGAQWRKFVELERLTLLCEWNVNDGEEIGKGGEGRNSKIRATSFILHCNLQFQK